LRGHIKWGEGSSNLLNAVVLCGCGTKPLSQGSHIFRMNGNKMLRRIFEPEGQEITG
jgi:hypothetical protein